MLGSGYDECAMMKSVVTTSCHHRKRIAPFKEIKAAKKADNPSHSVEFFGFSPYCSARNAFAGKQVDIHDGVGFTPIPNRISHVVDGHWIALNSFNSVEN